MPTTSSPDPDEALTPRSPDEPTERIEHQARRQPEDEEAAPDRTVTGTEPGPGPDADDPMAGPAPTG
ncbi:MAG: hypothetical protein U0P45_07570 [Acidimicrobiales bacterium]